MHNFLRCNYEAVPAIQNAIANWIVLILFVAVTTFTIWRRFVWQSTWWQWTIVDLLRWTLVAGVLLSTIPLWIYYEICRCAPLHLQPSRWVLFGSGEWVLKNPPWLVRLPLLISLAACINLALRLGGGLLLAVMTKLFGHRGVAADE